MATAEPFASSAEIDTLLFDLDGTLVRLRRARLELSLLWRLISLFWPHLKPWALRSTVWRAAKAMQSHGTSRTNFEVLVGELARESRLPADEVEARLRGFFAESFPRLSRHFVPIEGAKETLALARDLGYRVVLATNPVWPEAAVKVRLAAGGLGDFRFDYVSHSEVMTRCKPDPAYYEELLARLSTRGANCLMIGNDLTKDLPAKALGIRTFIVHHPPAVDERIDAQGSLADVQTWLRQGGARR